MLNVSSVIVTYNRRSCLERAVNSIRSYCPSDTEIIVVDNASEDDTWQWLQRQEDVIALQSPSNCGPGPGRNMGIRAAGGETVFFLDDDAYLVEPVVEIGLEELEKGADVGGVAFPIWEATLKSLLYGGRSGQVKCFAAGGALFRKSALEAAGLFDEQIRWSEEFDLSVRLYAAGYRIIGVSRPQIHHQATTSMAVHSTQKLRAVTYGRLRSFLINFRWHIAMLFAGRLLLSMGWAGLKARHFLPVPLAVWDIARSWPELVRIRKVVPRRVEEFFITPDSLEDEYSMPLWRKAVGKIQEKISSR